MSVISVFYTNCGEGGDTSAIFDSGSSAQSDCFFNEDCEEDFDTTGDDSYLELEILNPDPTFVKNGQNQIEVTGGCNDGDFQQNRIIWEIQSNTGRTLFGGSIPNACVKNDFQLLLQLPNNEYDPNFPHILQLELIAIDVNGEEHRSTLNAVKQIQLQPES